MTTSDNIQEVQEDITPAIEELNDLELEAIAGGKESIFSYPVSTVYSGAGTSDGKVSETVTRTVAHVKTMDLPTVGGVASRASTLPEYSVGISTNTR